MSDKQGVVSVSSSPDMAASEGLEIYHDDIDLYIQEYIASRGLDRNKIPSTQWAAALMYVNACTFRRDNSCLLDRSPQNTDQYNIIAVMALCDRYIYLCMDYNQRVCLEHFSFLSGIAIQTLYEWRYDSKPIYIYDPEKGVVRDSRQLTVRRSDVYKKLIQNTIIAADDLVLSKAGVNSIAYRNAVQERYASRAADQVQALDVGSIADQLGIASDVALLSDSSK